MRDGGEGGAVREVSARARAVKARGVWARDRGCGRWAVAARGREGAASSGERCCGGFGGRAEGMDQTAAVPS